MTIFCSRAVWGRRVWSYSLSAWSIRLSLEVCLLSAKAWLNARYKAYASSKAKDPPEAKAPPCGCALSPAKVARLPNTQVDSNSPAEFGYRRVYGVAWMRARTTGFQSYERLVSVLLGNLMRSYLVSILECLDACFAIPSEWLNWLIRGFKTCHCCILIFTWNWRVWFSMDQMPTSRDKGKLTKSGGEEVTIRTNLFSLVSAPIHE